ncbi:MAG: SH3 domain-containing protein [Geminicoccaceae bacterium]
MSKILRRQSMWLLLLTAAAWLQIAHAQEEPNVGRSTGLPVPRFVSLGDNEVNVRFGPGTQYPIYWKFTQTGIPVEIISEFDNWRKIRDFEGEEGWIRSNLLDSQRTIMVQGAVRDLLRTPSKKGRVLLRAEPGVIGLLFECEDAWCRVEIDGRRGWLQRSDFWGTLPDEWRS